MKYIRKFESISDFEEIVDEFNNMIVDSYGLKNFSDVEKDINHLGEVSIPMTKFYLRERFESYYDFTTEKNKAIVFIEIRYFGADLDEFYDDLKGFVNYMTSFGYSTIDPFFSWLNRFRTEILSDELGDYLDISLCFFKKK